MHDCKASRNDLIDIALQPDASVTTELFDCPACRQEIAALRAAVKTTDAAMQLLQPQESFWDGYHARLHERLVVDARVMENSVSRERIGFGSAIRAFAIATVRVPAPVALAMFAFFIFSLFSMLKPRAQPNAVPGTPLTIVKNVEVPVVEQKLITQVVYRNRRSSPRQFSAAKLSPVAAAAERDDRTRIAQSLDGFKPAPEAKLTIMKGSSRDEK